MIEATRTIRAADLFCGAGGFSAGLLAAAEELGYDVDLLAINHWDTAIATHSANHPGVRHLCETLDSVDPRKVIPGGSLDLMVASPECIHHSKARGGKPMSDQSRATAWHVLRWAEALYIENIIVENVKEFRDWGPLGQDGRPIKAMKGALYKQFIRSLRALGYTVEDRVLVAADYGDPTTRQRLFVRARRGSGKITWPEPSHGPDGKVNLDLKDWKSARDVVDWSEQGTSIFGRSKPLADRTMERILTGLRKYSGIEVSKDGLSATVTGDSNLKPFIVVLRNNCDSKSIDEPIPTVAAGGNHIALAEPFIVNMKGCSIGRDIDKPLPTITAHAPHLYVAEPFILKYYGNGENVHSLDDPLGTITGKDRFGLVEPSVEGVLDIRFRMLQPRELAKAMSFPAKYTFTGNKAAQVKQIGNAVPVRTAAALCKSALAPTRVRKPVVPIRELVFAA